MNFLVDTHAVIWFITNDSSLPQPTKKLMEDADNKCWVSIASLWELGIKFSLGRIDMKADLQQIFDIIEKSGFGILPITPEHIVTNGKLKFHHRDPFDRIIIAQAITEKLAIITKDEHFIQYPAAIEWQK